MPRTPLSKLLLAMVVITLRPPTTLAQTSPENQVALASAPSTNALLDGVHEVAAPGVPGPLVVFGEHASVVICGKAEGNGIFLPVVACAELGKGRVVAFGHTGYLDKDTLKAADTGRLIENSLRWASNSDKPRVGVIDNDGLVNDLKLRGFDATSLTGKDWESRIAKLDVICAGQGRLSDAQSKSLHAFIADGHGLLMAGLGWGWLQVTHSSDIREHPGSRLLRDAGIAWADGTLEKTTKAGIAAEPPPVGAHALNALSGLESPHKDVDVGQFAATLTCAVRTLPADDLTIMHRCRELLKGHETTLVPTPKTPLTTKRGLDRTLLALAIELDRQLPADQVRAHPAAATFPGEVPADAPRIERQATIDLSIPGWHATGLYAPAGTVITLAVPETARTCSIRIGCHTDHLWNLDKWQRVPEISREWKLDTPEVRVASDFGGLIYIDVPRKASGFATITISGAVESPHFVLGQTSHDQWLKARAAPGPWADLETKKIAISVPSDTIRSLDNPDALMQFWDKISDAHATLATIPLDRERPERYVADIQISAGYMHSGYPIMTHLDAAPAMTSLEKLRSGQWGLFHELGHNHQSGDWTFSGTGEVTCNLFSLHAIDTICTPPARTRGHGAVDQPPSVRAYLDKGANFEDWKKDPFLALQMYIELQQAFGWETFKKVFAEYRALPNDQRPKNDDEKRDQWMVRFSRACGKNLGPFFQAWGVPTSEPARQSIAGLPTWMPEELSTK